MTDRENLTVVAATEANLQVSDMCYQTCNPEGIADYLQGQAVANYTMNRAFDPELPSEVTVEINAKCTGPKKTLLRGFKCPLKATCDLRAGYETNDTSE